MRLIGTIPDEASGIAFSLFLSSKGIDHQLEIIKNTDWGSSEYGTAKCLIWIKDEDQVEEATRWYDFYSKNPNDPLFKVAKPQSFLQSTTAADETIVEKESPEKQPVPMYRQPMGPLTRFLVIGMSLFFFISEFLTGPIDSKTHHPKASLFSSRVEKYILYDYPHTYELLDRFLNLYGYEAFKDPSSLPPEGQQLFMEINRVPYWEGIYTILEKDLFKPFKEWSFNAPMFEKIREGEIWRIITPITFHANLLHLFFNMLWLIVLGKQMELRLRGGKYLLFILIVGAISNTVQYLMSGPNFVGFSGVLTGMLAFVWVRQKDAAWEGYQLDKATMIFMLIYIFGLAAIQTISFLLDISFDVKTSISIANAAHISGLIAGYILGKMSFFSWRPT